MPFEWSSFGLSASQPFALLCVKYFGGCDVTITLVAILKYLVNTRMNQWGEIFGCFFVGVPDVGWMLHVQLEPD